MIKVFELATSENFSEVGYLLANPDVRTSAQQFSHTGRQHFDSHGRRESRRQITDEYLRSRDRLAKQKYARFKRVFDVNARFEWLRGPESFPISSSPDSFSQSDYLFGESANGGFLHFLADLQSNPDGTFVDIGCGLRDVVYENCLYIEVYPSITADLIVGPDSHYPLADSEFDGVCCAAVLEHVARPWIVVDEIYRILKPGGRCYIDWPFLQPVHGYPSHYYNATREGLRRMFVDRFEINQLFTHPAQSAEFSLCWILGRFVNAISDPNLRNRFCGMSISEILDRPPSDAAFWKPFLETFSERALEELSCGNCLIAKKPLQLNKG